MPQGSFDRLTVLTFKGISQPVRYWSKALGHQTGNLLYRLNHGWPLEKALQPKDLDRPIKRLRPKKEATARELVDGPVRWVIRGVESHAKGHPFECRCVECVDEVRRIERGVAACTAERRLAEIAGVARA